MSDLLLTQYSGTILGPIARVLGWILNGIYVGVYKLTGIENVSISIIILTILIYTLMYPLTYKQQKFSRLTQKMNPELQEIQKKYKDKKDQASMMKMQEETQAIYAKYGVSPTGSCLQAFIQLPIFFALYRVFYNIPAYVSGVKDLTTDLVSQIMATSGYQDTMTTFVSEHSALASLRTDFTVDSSTAIANYITDVIYKLDDTGVADLKAAFVDLGSSIDSTISNLSHVNNFFGMNISHTPMSYITAAFDAIKDGNATGLIIGLGFLGLMIPVLSYLSQLLSIKLMPTANTTGNEQMAAQMKTMNLMMPLMSFIICFTVPVGLGIYWIGSALVRTVQQLINNRRLDNLDLEDIIAKNQEKAKKKREKMGISENQIKNNARVSSKNTKTFGSNMSDEERNKLLDEAAKKKANAKAGSLAAKANLVKDFNERNNK